MRRHNEQFRFRVDADTSTGGGTIRSFPDGAGQDPGIGTGFRLLDGKCLKTTLAGELPIELMARRIWRCGHP